MGPPDELRSRRPRLVESPLVQMDVRSEQGGAPQGAHADSQLFGSKAEKLKGGALVINGNVEAGGI